MQERAQSDQQVGGRLARADPMVIAVNALGITQITAWGTSYYCLGVLAKPIVAETGWAMTTVFLGFTVALLVMGFISTWVGRLIDRIGARAVMSIGTIIVSAGLLALSQVHDQASYFAVWAVLGIGMRCCLYDAAFAALVQVAPTRGRKAISYLTLYGAYASTVFWVIGHYLNEAYGWRGTLIDLRGDQPGGLPASQLDWSFATRNNGRRRGCRECCGLTGWSRARRAHARRRHHSFRTHHVAQWLCFRRHLVAAGSAAGGGGPRWRDSRLGRLAQGTWPVRRPAGRDILRAQPQGNGHRAHRHRVVPASLLLLLLARGDLWQLVAFTLLLGAAQGVITIVRGAVPLALFGAKGYGAVLGVIATPILLVNAFSPAIFALVVDQFGWQISLYALLGCSIATWIAIELMSRWHEGAQSHGCSRSAA